MIQDIKNQELDKDQSGRNVAPFPYKDISREMDKEEPGYLGVHLAFVPILKKDDSGKPINDSDHNGSLLPPESILKSSHVFKKRDRKRFRGNDPTPKQGGDPKVNLLKRIKAQGMAERNDIQRILDDVERRNNLETKGNWPSGSLELPPLKKTRDIRIALMPRCGESLSMSEVNIPRLDAIYLRLPFSYQMDLEVR